MAIRHWSKAKCALFICLFRPMVNRNEGKIHACLRMRVFFTLTRVCLRFLTQRAACIFTSDGLPQVFLLSALNLYLRGIGMHTCAHLCGYQHIVTQTSENIRSASAKSMRIFITNFHPYGENTQGQRVGSRISSLLEYKAYARHRHLEN